MIGTHGRVGPGLVGPGLVGEVVLPLPSGGTQPWYARPDPGLPAGEEVPKGTTVVVTQVCGPRTVWVCPLEPSPAELGARQERAGR